MSDDMDVTPAAPGADAVAITKDGASSSSTGKIIAVIVGLALLGIVVGVVAAIVLSGIGDRLGDELQVQVEQSVPGSSDTDEPTSDGVVAQAAAPALEVLNSELFTFRDIFDPLIKPTPAGSSTTATSTAPSVTDTETPYAQGVLYLTGVETVDGVMKAVLSYNGQTYTLGPGEGIPGTPWEVFSVSSSSVTMLYGDVRVTLAVGQGISK